MTTISAAEVKSRFSELLSRSTQERFIITRRGRQVAALVSINDLRIIEQYEERQGLAAVAGKWPGFDEVAESMSDLSRLREQGGEGRDVSL